MNDAFETVTSAATKMAERQVGAEQLELSKLVSAHNGYVKSVIRGFGVREADAPDVAQDVWLVVHRRLDGFEGSSGVRTWLHAICRRVSSDYRRRAFRRYESLAVKVPEVAVEPLQHRQLEAEQRLRATENVLVELSPDRLDILRAVTSGTTTIPVLARRHRCADKTIFSRLYAAREQLRRSLREGGFAAFFGMRVPAGGGERAGLWNVGGGAPSGIALTSMCALALLALPPVNPSASTLAPTLTDSAPESRFSHFVTVPSATLGSVEPEQRSPRGEPKKTASLAQESVPRELASTPSGTTLEFTVLDIAEPTAGLHLHQVAFMEFVLR